MLSTKKTIKIKKLVFVSIMHWICTIETELLLFFVSEIVRSAATRVTNTLTENWDSTFLEYQNIMSSSSRNENAEGRGVIGSEEYLYGG